jgi:hypothetical protein
MEPMLNLLQVPSLVSTAMRAATAGLYSDVPSITTFVLTTCFDLISKSGHRANECDEPPNPENVECRRCNESTCFSFLVPLPTMLTPHKRVTSQRTAQQPHHSLAETVTRRAIRLLNAISLATWIS